MTLLPRKKILFVEDDPVLAQSIMQVLSDHGYEVHPEVNGRAARDLLDVQPFDLLLTEVRLPGVRGLEILHHIKSRIGIPVVLMGVRADIATEQDALDLGASGFLFKPVDPLAVVERVSQILKRVDPLMLDSGRVLDSEFCRVRIEDFQGSQVLNYPVFVRINDSKFLKIAHDGGELVEDRIQGLRARGIEFLYLRKEDFAQYVGFQYRVAQEMIQSRGVEKSKKIQVAHRSMALVYESFYYQQMRKSDYEDAVDLIQNSVALLSSVEDALELMEQLNQSQNGVYTHSVGVSLYSGLICRALGWTSSSTLMKVSMGGLLHDIGKKDFPKDLLDKPKLHMTDEEVHLYESHPELGVRVLYSLKEAGADVLQIIAQHHELSDGSGFPRKLRSPEIFPLAKVVSLANVFCNLVMRNANSPGYTPHEALNRLNQDLKQKFDANVLKALNRVFGRDVKN